MSKHFWLSKTEIEKIRLTPYTDVIVGNTKITLKRTDTHASVSVGCSNQDVLCQLHELLINGYLPSTSSKLLEDETISAWLAICIQKGVIE